MNKGLMSICAGLMLAGSMHSVYSMQQPAAPNKWYERPVVISAATSAVVSLITIGVALKIAYPIICKHAAQVAEKTATEVATKVATQVVNDMLAQRTFVAGAQRIGHQLIQNLIVRPFGFVGRHNLVASGLTGAGVGYFALVAKRSDDFKHLYTLIQNNAKSDLTCDQIQLVRGQAVALTNKDPQLSPLVEKFCQELNARNQIQIEEAGQSILNYIGLHK